MRILHWTESYHPNIGGMEVFSRQLATKIKSLGHECLILTDNYGGYPEYEILDGIPIYRFGFGKAIESHNLAEIIHLTRQVNELKKGLAPNILHLHTNRSGGFFYLRTKPLSSLPSVYTTHDPILQFSTGHPMLCQIFRSVDRIAAISSFMFQSAIECDEPAVLKTRLVLNAYPMPTINPTLLPYDPPVFLGLGRLVNEKGFDLFLDAFARVIKHFPSAKMILAGDGPLSRELKTQAQKLGINESVEFRGWVAPQMVPALINESSFVVVPSRWQEPFGLVALQAAQMARPVIAARVGGLPEIIQNGQSGFLFDTDNVQALESAMLTLLKNNNQASQMGYFGRQYVERNFNWDQCVSSYISMYREIAQ